MMFVERYCRILCPSHMLLPATPCGSAPSRSSRALSIGGFPLVVVAIFVAAFCFSGNLHAQESGQVPYSVIHKAVTRAQQVKHPKLRAVVRVDSKAQGTKPREIAMIIQAKSGPINVAIADGGEIRSFPVSDELLKENPPVLSNQPKGSSRLQVGIELVVPDTLTYSGRELAQLIDVANAEIKKQAGMLSLLAPRAKAFSFHFRGGGKQTVTINGKEPQTLSADASGVARLEIDKSFAAQDPQIVLSEKPTKVLVN